jgi:hypothetical protein
VIDAWTVSKAALSAYRHREDVAKIWERVLTALAGKKSSIAITGMPGVGKTVLLDYLSGRARASGYEPPGTSVAAEKAKLRPKKQRLLLRAVPGQETPERISEMSELFEGDNPVDGVIHVVSFGFTETRDALVPEVLAEQGIGSIDEYRRDQLQAEIDDLEGTCNALRRAIQRHRRPKWIIVAVNKLDLFFAAESRQAARSHYQSLDGPFTQTMSRFLHQVGTDNVGWSARPVCGWLDDFRLADDRVESQLNAAERDALVALLAEEIETRCGAG